MVRGVTSCEELCNITELFQNFVSKYNVEMTQDIKVINLMIHNPDFEFKTINISHCSEKIVDEKINSLTEFVNSFTKNNIFFNIKVNSVSKNVMYDCNENSVESIRHFEKQIRRVSVF